MVFLLADFTCRGGYIGKTARAGIEV